MVHFVLDSLLRLLFLHRLLSLLLFISTVVLDGFAEPAFHPVLTAAVRLHVVRFVLDGFAAPAFHRVLTAAGSWRLAPMVTWASCSPIYWDTSICPKVSKFLFKIRHTDRQTD
jgi:hypothetical protein